MATTTISALTAVSALNLDDTAVLAVDDANTDTRKATLAQLWTALAASARTFAGALTLDSTLAVTGVATFSDNVRINGVLLGNTASAGTATAGGLRATGASQFDNTVTMAASTSPFQMLANDAGASIGRRLEIGRNSNATTPAAGVLGLYMRNGSFRNIWVDASGDVRVGATDPTNANDGSGTVVGSQTSDVRTKTDIRQWKDHAALLDRVLALDIEDFRFEADAKRGGKRVQSLVIHKRHRGSWWTMNDHRPDNMAALDEAALFGALIGAVKAIDDRLTALGA